MSYKLKSNWGSSTLWFFFEICFTQLKYNIDQLSSPKAIKPGLQRFQTLLFQPGHEATPTLQQNQVVQQTQSVPQQVRYNSQWENLIRAGLL